MNIPQLPEWYANRGGISKAFDITTVDAEIARRDLAEWILYATKLRKAEADLRADAERFRHLESRMSHISYGVNGRRPWIYAPANSESTLRAAVDKDRGQ